MPAKLDFFLAAAVDGGAARAGARFVNAIRGISLVLFFSSTLCLPANVSAVCVVESATIIALEGAGFVVDDDKSWSSPNCSSVGANADKNDEIKADVFPSC